MSTRNILILAGTAVIVAVIVGAAFNAPALRSIVSPPEAACPPGDAQCRADRIRDELDQKYPQPSSQQ